MRNWQRFDIRLISISENFIFCTISISTDVDQLSLRRKKYD